MSSTYSRCSISQFKSLIKSLKSIGVARVLGGGAPALAIRSVEQSLILTNCYQVCKNERDRAALWEKFVVFEFTLENIVFVGHELPVF